MRHYLLTLGIPYMAACQPKPSQQPPTISDDIPILASHSHGKRIRIDGLSKDRPAQNAGSEKGDQTQVVSRRDSANLEFDISF